MVGFTDRWIGLKPLQSSSPTGFGATPAESAPASAGSAKAATRARIASALRFAAGGEMNRVDRDIRFPPHSGALTWTAAIRCSGWVGFPVADPPLVGTRHREMLGRWRHKRRHRANRQQGDPSALEREGDPRGGVQD